MYSGSHLKIQQEINYVHLIHVSLAQEIKHNLNTIITHATAVPLCTCGYSKI